MTGSRERTSVDILEALAIGSVAATALALARSGVELTFAQWRVLVVVDEEPDGAIVGTIADRTGSAPSPASRLVARMRDHGLVTTEPDDHDRRATRVRLTARGREVRDLVVTRRRELLERAATSVDPLEPRVLEVLEALAAKLRAVT